jgi:hypothetical protein
MEPWDRELIRRQGAGTLVQIAREGRLRRAGNPVELSWVDEAALALLEAAIAQGRGINFVYPAPAGEVSVLLAAQVLVRGLLRQRAWQEAELRLRELYRTGDPRRFATKSSTPPVVPVVGIVTADPTGAARVWDEITIAGKEGTRAPISDVFPSWRAGPNGEPPYYDRSMLRGVLIGSRSKEWPVDLTIVDHLAGPVRSDSQGPLVRVFADPLDPEIEAAAARGDLIWGWSDSILGLWHDELKHSTVSSCAHEEAEKALARLRDDLSTLHSTIGDNPPRHLELGLRVAWSHTATLAALPCRPSQYDQFAGIPPRAARSTSSFEREIAAWANTLDGELAEYASIVASDIADLRAALERGNPFSRALEQIAKDSTPTLVVVRTRTAARGLLASLGVPSEADGFGNVKLAWFGMLHRYGTVPRVAVVGAPARSAWHRLDSGLSRDLRILVLGEAETRRTEWGARTLRASRSQWASTAMRERVWRELVSDEPPPPPIDVPYELPKVLVQEGPGVSVEQDPFSPLGALLRDDRPLIAEEGVDEQVAEEKDDGHWEAAVDSVEIETDHGYVLLPREREVDVMDDEPVSYTAGSLKPGMRMVIGRHSGRVGLIEALEDRLAPRHRADLLAARLLVREYQDRVHRTFAESGLSVATLQEQLSRRGCTKVELTIRSWVTPGGPMAPRDRDDLWRLNDALGLKYTTTRLHEIYSALMRIRTFRRAAGNALARAAGAAAFSRDDSRVDAETGLSVADLRDAVIVATVKRVRDVTQPVRLTDTGRLHEVSRC